MHAVCPVQLTFLDLFILIIRSDVRRRYEFRHYAVFQIYYYPLSFLSTTNEMQLYTIFFIVVSVVERCISLVVLKNTLTMHGPMNVKYPLSIWFKYYFSTEPLFNSSLHNT